jgi:predicted DNA-binding transcriptional regulator YafY
MQKNNHDTLHRQWQMLRMIPRYPSKITATQLNDKLLREGYSVSKRTIERDLQALSDSFPIVSDESEKPFGWSWAKDGAVFDLPGLSNSEALTFNLVEQHLRPILPASTLDQLQPFFKTATHKLGSLSENTPIHSWLDKVRVIQPTQTLLPPAIDADAHRVVSEALLLDKQIKITYKKSGEDKTADYTIHPLGLVERGQMIYLVCKFSNYEDIRTLALHRFRSAEMLDAPCMRPAGFSLDTHIASGAFGFGGVEPIRLEAIFKRSAGNHLYETPLSLDQTITIEDDDHLKLTATVINTEQLRWWLLGFGELVEIIAPAQLRESIAQSIHALDCIYNKR